MKRTLLAAGAAALALGLPATAALADGYQRPAWMKPAPKAKPAPKPKAKPAPKPVARYKPAPKPHKPHGHVYAAKAATWEKFESVETTYTEERNGQVYGPVRSYSETYVAPHKGCYPQNPCGYSTGAAHGQVMLHHGGSMQHGQAVHGGAMHHGHAMHGAMSHGAMAEHGEHPHHPHGADGGHGHHEHGAHDGRAPHAMHQDAPYGTGHAMGHHGAMSHHGMSSYSRGYEHRRSSKSVEMHQGFHHGALSGGVGYGVDGGPVYGGQTVIIRPRVQPQGYYGGHVQQGGWYNYGSGASAHSGSSGAVGFGYGPSYGPRGDGYTGFKPSPLGHGIGAQGYTGFRR